MVKEALLFLAHRLPYPPNKGDKVRSYHFLKHLAERYHVFLGTFIDDPADWRYVESLRPLCAGIQVEPIVPWTKRGRSVTAFLSGEALTLPYFRSPKLRQWVEQTVVRNRITQAFAYSSPMAQYVLDKPQLRCLVDFVDMDSAKWAAYSLRRPWPISAFYGRESTRLLAFERYVGMRADASIFVTDDEARLFRSAAPECAGRVIAIRNGVDSEYFSPEQSFDSPFSPTERPVVFTGAMDYWPNVDAVMWFAREVLPKIRRRDPSVRFYVVGMNPDSAVSALAGDPAVTVTGRVDDVRPYLQHAQVVVAPLRVARGIQNKVLEAMAMARPIVVTTASASALSVRQGVELEVASEANEYAAKVLDLIEPARAQAMGNLARARILRDYTWAASYSVLDELLSQGSVAAQAEKCRPVGDVYGGTGEVVSL